MPGLARDVPCNECQARAQGSAFRALSGCPWPQCPPPFGLRRNRRRLIGNIYLEIQKGGTASSRGRLCVIEGDQYYLEDFYTEK